jgi:predicted nuclease of predicted toxin-antitoxin system
MRILIDECLNWRLGRALTGHYAVSVQRMGWSGVKNGDLLALAEKNQFDVFLTGDRNLVFQQSTTQFRVAVVVLEAPGIQLHQTLPLMQKVLALLSSLRPGQVVRLGP